MVTLTRAQRLNLPLAPAVAIASGLFILLIILAMPAALLERLVGASGIPAVVAAAEPPLGVTARIVLGLLLGGGVTGFLWFGLALLDGDRPLTLGSAGAMLRRGDIHPDAPPRPPLFATRDLGTPFLDVWAPIEQALPRDLDQPMAGFDPGALLHEPLPAPEPIAPLALVEPVALPRPALIDPGDRIETFELTPVERSAPLSLRVPSAGYGSPPRPESTSELAVAPETEATVHDLLTRLERGIAGKASGPAPLSIATPRTNSLADTLGDLRRLATSAR